MANLTQALVGATNYTVVSTDTKNTAGSTDTSSKIFLIGATSQAANPQTYSHDTAYIDTDGCLYSGGTKVLTAHQDISGKADKSATVSTVTWSNNKLTKTINGTTSDVVSAATILGNLTSSQVTSALGFTPTANTGTITSVKTTAGAHTTINVSSGAANFNVPTKTSHLTNDSGFVTTDEKVKQTPNTTSTDSYPVLFSSSTNSGEVVGGTYKNPDFYYSPSFKRLTLNGTISVNTSTNGQYTKVSGTDLTIYDTSDAYSIMQILADDIILPDVQVGGTTYENNWGGISNSLQASISSLKSSLSDLFVTRTETINVSLSNEWYKNKSYTPPAVDGYTPIAIQSWFCGAVDYYPIKVSLDSVYIVRYVHTAETKSVTFNVTILYVKTSVL